MNKVELYNEFWKEKKTVDYLFIKNKNATVLRAYLTKCDQKYLNMIIVPF